jgi:hypothetical protein
MRFEELNGWGSHFNQPMEERTRERLQKRTLVRVY